MLLFSYITNGSFSLAVGGRYVKHTVVNKPCNNMYQTFQLSLEDEKQRQQGCRFDLESGGNIYLTNSPTVDLQH